MTLKPAAWMCPKCGNMEDRHQPCCFDAEADEDIMNEPLFTRDDLVRVANTMRADAVRVARSMAPHDVDPDLADDIEDAVRIVAEMLGEVEK